MAEVVRGGLQAIHAAVRRRERRSAWAIGGLWAWWSCRKRCGWSFPGIVNSFISLFKDTTLVLTSRIFDLLD